MLKRAARGHNPAGVDGTAEGELALACRACPAPGKNLPDGWNKVPSIFSYVSLHIAVVCDSDFAAIGFFIGFFKRKMQTFV